MDTNSWVEHLNVWKNFLSECISSQDDLGERIKAERQLSVLERVRYGAALNPSLVMSFIDPPEEDYEHNSIDDSFLNLNESQKIAVYNAIKASTLSLIKGPPGTGKTQVISEICLQLFNSNPQIRILICSETHVAVNNLINRISDANNKMRIVRIRDKEGDEQIDAYSPETIVNTYLKWAKQCQFADVAYSIVESELSDVGDKSLEKALALSANIVGVTCNRLASYDFNNQTEIFDVAIVDEVCKATLPEILAPLLVSKKAILLGDPNQLPPVFCSEEIDVIRRIDDCNLDKYMYIDELFNVSRNTISLNTQYRMNKEIGSMISNVFYNGTITNGRDASDDKALTWITYNPTKAWPEISKSNNNPQVYNEEECSIISDLIGEIKQGENSDKRIAIITPYKAQSKRLRNLIDRFDGIQVDTVDGFQGKEADIVIFSVTRTTGSYRFLADPRRLNVALSRAKDKIFIVGDINYCKRNDLLRSLSDYFVVRTKLVY